MWMGAQKAKEYFYTPDQFDNDTVFRKLIESVVTPEMSVLDAGAGAGDAFAYDLKGKVNEMVGVDLDPRVTSNPRLHSGVVSDLTAMPFEDGAFDCVFSRYVLEHIAEPQTFLAEMYRILRPGGYFLFLTPNKWHYVSIGSRLTPHGFHDWYNRKRGRDDEDTFPTFYRLNSTADLRREFHLAQFDEKQLILRECSPNYLTFSLPSFLLGVLYERIVNSSDILGFLRVNMLGVYIKRG